MKKNNFVLYLCIAIFGIIGIYLTFFASSISGYDSKIEAYNIDPNESRDSDGTTYNPIYYFRVNGVDYECKASIGSSSYPDADKKMVYYDSSDPTKCKTEYETKSNRLGGVICLIATGVMIFFFIIKKPSATSIEERTYTQPEYSEADAEKVMEVVNKVQLIYKRVILGIVIAILLFFILLDGMLVKQTFEARNYIETTAKFSSFKEEQTSENFVDYIFEFTDKQGQRQEIIVTRSNGSGAPDELKIKYDENNPQEYYEETALLDKSGIIWFVVKVVAVILLVVLFFNEKLLNKIHLSISNK
jgi:hypothetical protein